LLLRGLEFCALAEDEVGAATGVARTELDKLAGRWPGEPGTRR
jgi:hypothetical protein